MRTSEAPRAEGEGCRVSRVWGCATQPLLVIGWQGKRGLRYEASILSIPNILSNNKKYKQAYNHLLTI
jgi:hypothetical protein